ncbi:MAG: hypothetical protein ACYCOO_09070 [Chitinophagaceae bacterium]
MKPLLNMISSISFFLTLLIGCQKVGTQPYSNLSNYFPNKVGDYWVYKVSDSAQNNPADNSIIYTVKVLISGTSRLIDGTFSTIWQYQFPSGNYNYFVKTIGDTIKIFDSDQIKTLEGLNYPKLIFVQPFEVNKNWIGNLAYLDTFRVKSQEDVNLPTLKFSNCFDIFHHYTGPNIDDNDQYWFKPGIGFVFEYFSDYNFGPIIYRSMQLEKYYVQ